MSEYRYILDKSSKKHHCPNCVRDFFHSINFRKGRVSAVSATGRKLAVIIWNMVVKGTPYINPEGYHFLDQKRKLGIAKRIQKQIDKFALINSDLNFISN